jgi:hypothetical protein
MMEKSSDSSSTNPKPENTRAGGPDDSRTTKDGEKAPPKEQGDTPRGAPVDSRSSLR